MTTASGKTTAQLIAECKATIARLQTCIREIDAKLGK